jgi:hypothetical protein
MSVYERPSPRPSSALRSDKAEGQRQPKRRRAEEAWASSSDSPSVEELKRVKEMADERGGLEKVASLIGQVDEMAKAVGGVD